MSKRESVVFQVNNVLKNAYHQGYGRSRYADKRNAKNNSRDINAYTKDKIYSEKTFKSTQKTCIAFVKYCREEFGIKYLFEIKAEMFSSFILKGDFKNGRAYDPKTAATYKTQITKLQNAFNSQNKEMGITCVFVDKSYKEHLGEKEHKRDMMPKEIHDKIIEKCYNGKYENALAFDTARSIGLRVREITNLRKEDFKFNKNGELEKIHIHRSKGGRNRDIEVHSLTREQINVVEKTYNHFKSSLEDHDRLFPNKAGSYETAFRRARDFTTNGEYNHCNVHSLRKEFANDYYYREVSKGREVYEVKKELTEILGHNRIEVLSSYLSGVCINNLNADDLC